MSDSESESETGSNYEGQSEDEQFQQVLAASKLGHGDSPPTDGVSSRDKHLYGNVHMDSCSICNKWFEENMMIPSQNPEETTCMHCYFWLNYDVAIREIADCQYVDYGISAVNYVSLCSEEHCMAECPRHGACLLCDFRNGVRITNIVGADALYPDNHVGKSTGSKIVTSSDNVIMSSDRDYFKRKHPGSVKKLNI